jgi:hypothetical protein
MRRLRRRTREGVGFEFARVGFEFARGLREKVRGVYGFSSLVKQKIQAKNYAVFCFAGKRNFFLYIFMM